MTAPSRPPRGRLPRAVLAALLLVPPLAGPLLADTPPGFTDTVIATLPYPTGLAFTPDGRILITTQPGALRVFSGGALLPTAALDLGPVACTNAERGLLGVAVDPGFSTNRHIYLFYTFNRYGSPAPCPTGTGGGMPVNRVSRFVLPDSNVIDPASELPVIDHIPSPAGNHNAGDLHFGADGLLYASTGDGAVTPLSARDRASLNGKILRVLPDGSIPAGNPFAASPGMRRCGDPAGPPAGSGPCGEIFALGLRNPFRFGFRPGSNEFFINDVGANLWEEIDEGAAGADYGWNQREGPCNNFVATDCGPPPPGMTNPIYSYAHSSGCTSLTGGAFVPAGLWPPPWEASWLFGDIVCGKVSRLEPDGAGGYRAVDFLTNLGRSSVVAMAFGPDGASQALYWTDYTSVPASGRLHKVVYVGSGNRAPLAAATATPRFGALPLAVDFDGGGSSDPDLDPLTWDWDFGDGNTLPGQTTPLAAHSYAAAGVWTATLVVRDDRGGASSPFPLRIDAGNTPPSPSILTPAPAARFRVGEPVSLGGTASDAEDGPLPAGALLWEATLHHIDELNPAAEHTHPLLPPTPGTGVPLIAPAPEDFQATRLTYVELRLSATDSWGLSATVSQRFEPSRVDLSFDTAPTGLSLTLLGAPFVASRSVVSWVDWGFALGLGSPLQLDAGGLPWRFASWSDGGAATHIVTTPAAATSYVASFLDAQDLSLAPALLRNDDLTDLASAPGLLGAIFAAPPGDPSLEVFGADRLGDEGEGGLGPVAGSGDDDDCYLHGVAAGSVDPEATLLADGGRPLVFYQLDQRGRVLKMVKNAGRVGIEY